MKHNNTHNINSWVIVLGPSKVFKRKTPLEEPYDGKCYSFPKCDLDNLSTFCDGLSMEFKCYAQSHNACHSPRDLEQVPRSSKIP